MGNDLESRVAAIERELAAARRADVAEVRITRGDAEADLILALGIKAAQASRHFILSAYNSEERLKARCIECGGEAGLTELAAAPFPHQATCALAPPA